VKERLAGQRAALLAERQELPAQIATLSSEGKRLVESLSSVTGTGRRLFDTKLQDVGDQLGRLEARLRDVERRICLLDDCEVEAEWVSRCLADFNQVWDTLSSENRGRLVRAVIERVEVDEPKGDVRTFIANLGAADQRQLFHRVSGLPARKCKDRGPSRLSLPRHEVQRLGLADYDLCSKHERTCLWRRFHSAVLGYRGRCVAGRQAAAGTYTNLCVPVQ
jgi:hypothetical protein